jgi:acetyltransferase-like isoleucine patch superfamily enzyme
MFLHNIKKHIKNRVFNFRQKKNNIKIAISANISRNSIFEGANRIYSNSSFSGEMGYGTYIGNNTNLINTKIGRFCSISDNITCRNDTHPTGAPFVSTSPMFYSLPNRNSQTGQSFASKQYFDEFKYVDDEKKYSLIIGNDVWIGDGALFIGAIKVGDGAIIAARAVVTKNVPPYSIVGGIPAKIIKYRYDDETINFLLKLKWWKKNIEWFQKNVELMCDIEKLKRNSEIFHSLGI